MGSECGQARLLRLTMQSARALQAARPGLYLRVDAAIVAAPHLLRTSAASSRPATTSKRCTMASMTRKSQGSHAASGPGLSTPATALGDSMRDPSCRDTSKRSQKTN